MSQLYALKRGVLIVVEVKNEYLRRTGLGLEERVMGS
jgi:hypothetical protein